MRTSIVLSLILMAAVLVPVFVNRWAARRFDEVDDYYEREPADSPILGGGPWPNGGGNPM